MGEGLKDVGQAGHQAGDAVAAGMKDAANATHNMGSAVKSSGSEVRNFLAAQMSLSAAKNLASSLGDEYKRVAQEVANASKEFQAFRASLQGVASLSGQQSTNKFAAAEIASA